MAPNRPRALQIYDPVLSNVARRYKPEGFIARELAPAIPVAKLSGQYPVFTKRFWFANDVDNLVADRSPAKEVDFEWSTEQYLCDEYALKVGWTDLEREQADPSLKFEIAKAELLTLRMELAHEVRVANVLRKTGVGNATAALNLGATPSVNWDQDTATIEADIKTGVLAIYDATGQLPNTIVIPYKVAYAMALQEDIRAILRQDTSGQGVAYLTLGSRIIPAVIHGMRVIIPQGAQVDGANEGAAADSITEIWGDHVRLLKIDTSAQWGQPTVLYDMRHTAKRITKWSQIDPDLNYIREMERYDLKVVAPDTGYELTALLS